MIEGGVGRDNISDFTTNLIKEFLLAYTQAFAQNYIHESQRRDVIVPNVRFNFATETWESDTFDLPWYELEDDFVLLTPKDILTKDDVWISHSDLYGQFDRLLTALPNEQLRAQVNNYFLSKLPEDPDQEDHDGAAADSLREFPILIEYYIRFKEDHGEEAVATSKSLVRETQALFVKKVDEFSSSLALYTPFYEIPGDTYEEARERVLYLKDVIENKGGQDIFFQGGQPIRRESDLHILFRLCWLGTPSDVSQEVNDGRGPSTFSCSPRGRSHVTVNRCGSVGRRPRLDGGTRLSLVVRVSVLMHARNPLRSRINSAQCLEVQWQGRAGSRRTKCSRFPRRVEEMVMDLGGPTKAQRKLGVHEDTLSSWRVMALKGLEAYPKARAPHGPYLGTLAELGFSTQWLLWNSGAKRVPLNLARTPAEWEAHHRATAMDSTQAWDNATPEERDAARKAYWRESSTFNRGDP